METLGCITGLTCHRQIPQGARATPRQRNDMVHRQLLGLVVFVAVLTSPCVDPLYPGMRLSDLLCAKALLTYTSCVN